MIGAVEMATGLVAETLFIVTNAKDGEALMATGIGRGRIVSPKELEILRDLKLDKDALRALLEAKVQFDARIQDLVKPKAEP